MIQEYRNLKEKEEYFKCYPPIETTEQFDSIWNGMCSWNLNAIYRGTKSGSYKLYNSLQRVWQKYYQGKIGVGYYELTKNLLEVAKLNDDIRKCFNNEITESNDLAYLSYLQHHWNGNDKGAPTPLLDFTFNPFIALYFAFEKEERQEKEKFNVKFECENYCSFYILNLDYFILQGYQNLFYSFVNSASNDQLSYNKINTPEIYHLYTDNDAFQILNNQRIKNQEGTFFVNNHQELPLEKKLKFDIEWARSENRLPANTKSQILSCHEINTNLREYVIFKLENEKGITRDFIYPNTSK